jgi:3-deoxy-D-manno-octulosonate 8-phosphate phosphatase (KDO 8-P phosphatase)
VSPQDRARTVKLLVCDVDGVLTNGQLIYLANGGEAKAFNTLDGLGIQALKASGVGVEWLTARASDIVERRAKELGVVVHQGVREKGAAIEHIAATAGIDLAHVAYIGDDWLDLPALTRVGFACTVPNASAAVKKRVHWIASATGGEGAVRELCEMILEAQGTLDAALVAYLR